MLVPLAADLRKALVPELNILTPSAEGEERCRRFLAEAPGIVYHRKELEKKRERLGMAQAAVRGYDIRA